MLTVLFVGLAGCVHLDFEDVREGRVLLQIRDDRTGDRIEGVIVRVVGHGGEAARGVTNAAGNVGLTFQAPTVLFRSSSPVFGWVVLRLEAPAYAPLEIPCDAHDFVETSRIRVLTRGVALRRTS